MILPGNNSALIKKCMKHRINWKKCNDRNSMYNFKWKANSKDIDFSNCGKRIKQVIIK